MKSRLTVGRVAWRLPLASDRVTQLADAGAAALHSRLRRRPTVQAGRHGMFRARPRRPETAAAMNPHVDTVVGGLCVGFFKPADRRRSGPTDAMAVDSRLVRA